MALKKYDSDLSKATPEEKETRKGLFGDFSDGFNRIKPFKWKLDNSELLEIPVSTIPLIKTPDRPAAGH